MWKWSDLIGYIGRHPGESLGFATLAFMVAYVVAGVLMAWRLARQERDQDEERKRFERILQANEKPRTYPPPAGPKGFDRDKNRMAS